MVHCGGLYEDRLENHTFLLILQELLFEIHHVGHEVVHCGGLYEHRVGVVHHGGLNDYHGVVHCEDLHERRVADAEIDTLVLRRDGVAREVHGGE